MAILPTIKERKMDLEEKCAVCSNTFGQHRAKTGACPRRDPDEPRRIIGFLDDKNQGGDMPTFFKSTKGEVHAA
ncbi:hypothetical protein AUK40_00690 [Candidatus Wirthbacteria bacterium CG2_30_54_11]|uniref:Uncharacterized protein n=1 Tax=Candidatus Wirthbacteria bacterium CG2_30_54_11 TaxID=1817892 RepID=A0A1J5IQU6_9BACT|nr:MAG: hypothetical protein AUK40_00690 [Candidatus Wirthbacteria bacterium CG2_30_54_11]